MRYIQYAAVTLIGFSLAAFAMSFITPADLPLSIGVGCLAGLFCSDVLAECKRARRAA